MRSLADLDAFTVEIQVPLSNGMWRHGSGYLIGPCRILTALHVLIGQDAVLQGQPVSVPDRIEMRAFGDFTERFGRPDVVAVRYLESVRAQARDGDYLWRPAELLWPKDGTAVPRFDLAILTVKPEAALKHILNAPRISCFKPTEDISCRCTGFPEWMAARTWHGVDISNPRPVTGDLTFGPPTNLSFHPFTAKNGAPRDANEWQGLSGSAFFAQDTAALVGVASAVLPTSGNDGLWLTQLADLAEGDEFQEFWTAAAMARPSRLQVPVAVPQFLIDPLPYLHEFDRKIQEDRIIDAFDPMPTDQPDTGAAELPKKIDPDERAPPIFLIAGRWIDLPEEMVQRIRRQIAPEFIGIRDGNAVSLKWRYIAEGYSPNQIVAKLKEEIASSLNVKRSRHIASLAPLSAPAKGQDWNLFVSVDKATEQDAKALCQFLAEFAKFERSERPPSLYVNIVPGEATIAAKQDSRVTTFIGLVNEGSVALADRILIVDNIYLQDCEFVDIRYWSESLEQYCRVTAQQCRTYLERVFPNGTYPLHEVKECLSGALAR
jgi:hypothetical protein